MKEGKMIKFRAVLLVLIAGMVIFFGGCWIPENFKANVTVNKDGGYTFTYDGTLVYAPTFTAAEQGELTKTDEEDGEKKLKETPDIEKVAYLGKGRYKVYAEKRVSPGNDYDFMDIFSVDSQPDGSIEITVVKLEDDARKQLKSIGAKINGELTVSLKKGVKVINHNAQRKPLFFGLFGSYKWESESFDDVPLIVVKPAFN